MSWLDDKEQFLRSECNRLKCYHIFEKKKPLNNKIYIQLGLLILLLIFNMKYNWDLRAYTAVQYSSTHTRGSRNNIYSHKKKKKKRNNVY